MLWLVRQLLWLFAAENDEDANLDFQIMKFSQESMPI